MLENKFQSRLIKELHYIFIGCIVLKNDPEYMLGVPDLLVLYKNKWAMLECKKSLNDIPRDNQAYYVKLFNEMSFSRTICPENKEEVLRDLQYAFLDGRQARISER